MRAKALQVIANNGVDEATNRLLIFWCISVTFVVMMVGKVYKKLGASIIAGASSDFVERKPFIRFALVNVGYVLLIEINLQDAAVPDDRQAFLSTDFVDAKVVEALAVHGWY